MSLVDYSRDVVIVAQYLHRIYAAAQHAARAARGKALNPEPATWEALGEDQQTAWCATAAATIASDPVVAATTENKTEGGAS